MTSSPSFIEETKRRQLILGLPLLSSLKQKNISTGQCSDIQLTHQLQLPNNNSTIPPPHLSVLSGFNLNPFAFQGRDPFVDKQHLTNNSFYQPDLFNCINNPTKHVSILSYDSNSIHNKETRNTSDSFYRNFLVPFKHHSNLSYRQDNQQEFLQHKRECINEGIIVPVLPIPYSCPIKSQALQSSSLFKPIRDKQLKEKTKIFVHYKNDKKIEKKEVLPFMCEHEDCGISYKTKKQKMFHHNKMNPECKGDTILILKLIAETKEILINNDNNNTLVGPNIPSKMNKLKKQYHKLICNMSLQEYGKYFAGAEF